jgi:hypothetical protein
VMLACHNGSNFEMMMGWAGCLQHINTSSIL